METHGKMHGYFTKTLITNTHNHTHLKNSNSIGIVFRILIVEINAFLCFYLLFQQIFTQTN